MYSIRQDVKIPEGDRQIFTSDFKELSVCHIYEMYSFRLSIGYCRLE